MLTLGQNGFLKTMQLSTYEVVIVKGFMQILDVLADTQYGRKLSLLEKV